MNERDQAVTGVINKKKGSSVAKRLLASAIYIPCLIIIARRGGLYYVALIDIMILVGLWEFYMMMEAKGLRPYKAIGIISGIVLSWYIFFQQGIYANFFLSIIFFLIMTLELARKEKGLAVYHISVTIFGVFYVAWLGSHLILLRELPHLKGLDYSLGFSFVIVVFAVTWCYDSGAFFIGSKFGKHKIFPAISPGKTLEGAIGGVAFSIIGILIARWLVAPYLSIIQAVGLALITSVVGQLGDVVESMIKRDVKIKDASATIPGHGGALDRFDSLLFTAPLIYYFFKYFILD
ncbi:MAG: phosphatidate cytidylyltransferase [Candidatus Krumholzibacteria bacterium]|nr:phosphatidate cytidylyltransferase [Candidatus Krumholzibacteria bacterium]